jgi:hypothetical protein
MGRRGVQEGRRNRRAEASHKRRRRSPMAVEGVRRLIRGQEAIPRRDSRSESPQGPESGAQTCEMGQQGRASHDPQTK